MDDFVYLNMCKIFSFDKEKKKISYRNKLLLQPFEKIRIYKTFLFEFCFLSKKGPVEFKNLNDIWLFNKNHNNEKEICMQVVNILLQKIEEDKVENDSYLKATVDLLKLNDYEKYRIFKYIQSIYSFYNSNYEYIFFSVIIHSLIQH